MANKVYTKFTQSLHKVYTKFTLSLRTQHLDHVGEQCLHKVYTTFTLSLHYVYTKFTLSLHTVLRNTKFTQSLHKVLKHMFLLPRTHRAPNGKQMQDASCNLCSSRRSAELCHVPELRHQGQGRRQSSCAGVCDRARRGPGHRVAGWYALGVRRGRVVPGVVSAGVPGAGVRAARGRRPVWPGAAPG